MILRDCTPVIADLNMHNMQVITESTVVRYIPASNKMDGMRCDIAAGFGELGKVIAHGNVRDDLTTKGNLQSISLTMKRFQKMKILNAGGKNQ